MTEFVIGVRDEQLAARHRARCTCAEAGRLGPRSSQALLRCRQGGELAAMGRAELTVPTMPGQVGATPVVESSAASLVLFGVLALL